MFVTMEVNQNHCLYWVYLKHRIYLSIDVVDLSNTINILFYNILVKIQVKDSI